MVLDILNQFLDVEGLYNPNYMNITWTVFFCSEYKNIPCALRGYLNLVQMVLDQDIKSNDKRKSASLRYLYESLVRLFKLQIFVVFNGSSIEDQA